ncbi:hypothetical protein C6Q18_26285 [Pseudomonas chlororaphis subsp. piscium]|nr:hypothetical protein C6Q18_26285 [Pseudomonas chlororaphis subsp. piscium]
MSVPLAVATTALVVLPAPSATSPTLALAVAPAPSAVLFATPALAPAPAAMALEPVAPSLL